MTPILGIWASQGKNVVTNSFELIASTTLSSATNIVTFSSIPQTYDRLQLRLQMIPNSNNNGSGYLYFNNDTTSGNYGAGEGYGVYNGSSYGNISLAYANNFPFIGTSQGLYTTYGGVSVINIDQYSNTSYNTTYEAFSGFALPGGGSTSSKAEVGRYYGIYLNTSAVTRLDFKYDAGAIYDMAAGSIFTLYGIKGS